jgi:hypothetical protein
MKYKQHIQKGILFLLNITFMVACSVVNFWKPSVDSSIIESISIPSMIDYWEIAEEKGHNWDPDAYIRRVRIDIKQVDKQTIDPEYIFTFRTPNDGTKIFSATCKGKICDTSLYTTKSDFPDCLPLKPDSSVISGMDAFVYGLENGGEDYFYSSNWSASVTLVSDCSINKPIWIIYFSQPFLNKNLTLTLDATTGEEINR